MNKSLKTKIVSDAKKRMKDLMADRDEALRIISEQKEIVMWAARKLDDYQDDIDAVTSPTPQWSVTELAHPAVRDYRDVCQECLDQAPQAISMARVTGSSGSTYGDTDGHFVTVSRVHALFTDQGERC